MKKNIISTSRAWSRPIGVLLVSAGYLVGSALASSPDDAEAAEPNAATAVTGGGTTGHLARWTGAHTLGDSAVVLSNGKVGIGGGAAPTSNLTVNGSDPAAATIRGTNTSAGKGVSGISTTGIGVSGKSGGTTAVQGETTSTASSASGVTGVVSSTSPGGYSAGVTGINNGSGNNGIGVYGRHATTGWGVYGSTPNGLGVYGHCATGVGVYGSNDDSATTRPGVRGDTNSTAADSVGVLGVINSTAPGANSAGVRGTNNGTSGSGMGVFGSQAGSGFGVYGTAPNGRGVCGQSDKGNGVYGQSTDGTGVYGASTNSFAGFFVGDVTVLGNLSKSSGSFKIDHPLDPSHKYLSHSFVESPDMMNIYNGNAELDENGEATVQMPDYFEALNKEVRYQLTCVGAFAPIFVAQKLDHNHFKIAGGKPGMEVSWQVTGVRHDAYADAHRIAVETPKSSIEVGRYLHPQLFGEPATKAIGNMQTEAPAPGAEPQLADTFAP